MAPEQLQRKPIDPRVDIFAYGVAAYELLTNQKPFPGENPGEILAPATWTCPARSRRASTTPTFPPRWKRSFSSASSAIRNSVIPS